MVGDLLGFNGEKATAFKIIIQLGAILAVMWEFRAKVIGVLVGLPSDPKARRFSLNLFLAFIPAVIFGLAFADLIEHWLFNPITVATALILGGIVMLWAERREHPIQAESVDDMTWQLALKVGFAQCLALIPGCNCGAGSNYVPGVGCQADASCGADCTLPESCDGIDEGSAGGMVVGLVGQLGQDGTGGTVLRHEGSGDQWVGLAVL